LREIAGLDRDVLMKERLLRYASNRDPRESGGANSLAHLQDQ